MTFYMPVINCAILFVMAMWCQYNNQSNIFIKPFLHQLMSKCCTETQTKTPNISLNVSKTTELKVDYRTRRAEQTLVNISRAVVERVESFKFLGVHITNDLSWSKHTKTVVKRARQNLFPLRRLA